MTINTFPFSLAGVVTRESVMIEPSHAYSPRVMSLLLDIFDFGQSGEFNLSVHN